MKSFRHGIHPAGGKELTAALPIRPMEATEEMVYPLSSHIGAPAIPTVEVGERVRRGGVIAKAGGFVSVPLHSAVSGRVRAIEPRRLGNGEWGDCLVLENDGENEPEPNAFVKRDPAALTPEEILNAIRDSGIAGMGGAGFPLHVKLMPKDPSRITCLIVNGAECEPYITGDHRLMLERGDVLLSGLSMLLRLFSAARGVVAIEDNKGDAIASLTERAAAYPGITVCPLRTKYPQGGERMLIRAVTGKRIHSGLLPADVGCIVVNVSSVIAAYEAVAEGMPLLSRVVTVSGDAVAAPCNLRVPIGVSHEAVLAAAGGLAAPASKLIAGGPMMGTALFDLTVPVTKTSGSLLAFREDPVAKHPTTPCVHCGKCLHACPENLVPQMLMAASDSGDFARYEKLHGMECIECGSCSYVCPAKRPLTQSFKYAKRMILAERKAKGGSGK